MCALSTIINVSYRVQNVSSLANGSRKYPKMRFRSFPQVGLVSLVWNCWFCLILCPLFVLSDLCCCRLCQNEISGPYFKFGQSLWLDIALLTQKNVPNDLVIISHHIRSLSGSTITDVEPVRSTLQLWQTFRSIVSSCSFRWPTHPPWNFRKRKPQGILSFSGLVYVGRSMFYV